MQKPSWCLPSNHDVLHARLFRHAHPLAGVEPHGIELRGELLVVAHLHLLVVQVPLGDGLAPLQVGRVGGHGVDTPVDEHAELRLAPPAGAFFKGLRRFALWLGKHCAREDKQSPRQKYHEHQSYM